MDEVIIGTTIGGYVVEERIKAGGMAVVYLARSPQGAPVAIKLLQGSWLEHQEVVDRFEREAIIMRELRHPHIVAYLDYGKFEHRPYIVMDYFPGGSLSERLKAIARINLQASARLLAQIGSALDYAHGKNIVHRDLKPGNILLFDDTHAALTDFGIARVLEMEHTRLTVVGQMPGTPHYMSPEQARGAIEELDHLSDLYSFTIIAYLLTTGSLPFTGSDPLVIINQHLLKTPPLPTEVNPDLPAAVNDVLLKGLAKQPADRYPTAKAFVEAYEQAIEGSGGLDIIITAARQPRMDGIPDPTPPSGARIFSSDALPIDREATFNPVELPRPTPHAARTRRASGRSRWGVAVLVLVLILGAGFFALSRAGQEPAVSVAAAPTPTPTATVTPTLDRTLTAVFDQSQTAQAQTLAAAIQMTLVWSGTLTVEAFTATPTATASATPTATLTITPSATSTASPTVTPSETPTASPTVTPSETPTTTPTVTPSETPTPSPTATITPSVTASPTVTPSATPSRTPLPTATFTPSPTRNPALPTLRPTLTPPPQTLRDLINAFLEAGRASAFNCPAYASAYAFLESRLTLGDPEFEPARMLIDENEDEVRRFYEDGCGGDNRQNASAEVSVELFGAMRGILNDFLAALEN